MLWLDNLFPNEFDYLSNTYGVGRAYEVFSAVELFLLIVVCTTFVGVLGIYWDNLIDWLSGSRMADWLRDKMAIPSPSKGKLPNEYKPRRAFNA